MEDTFFTQKHCDRCGKELTNGRIMSMFNTDCLCMECKRKETEKEGYAAAHEAEISAVKRGEKNFRGIGLPNKK